MGRFTVVRWFRGIVLALAFAVCHDAQAQRPLGSGGGREPVELPHCVSTLSIMRLVEVQKQIGLDEAATQTLEDLLVEYRDAYRKEMRQPRGQSMALIRQQIEGEYGRKLNTILDKKQQTRVHEIAVQAAGIYALQDPDVVKALSLTDQQRAKIAEMIIEHVLDTHNTVEGRHELLERALPVLTEHQREKLEKIQGKPFKFPRPAQPLVLPYLQK